MPAALRRALDIISQNDDTKSFRPQLTLQSDIPFIPQPPNARSNWFPGTLLKQRDNTVASFVEYDLTDWLTAYVRDRRIAPDLHSVRLPRLLREREWAGLPKPGTERCSGIPLPDEGNDARPSIDVEFEGWGRQRDPAVLEFHIPHLRGSGPGLVP